MPASAGAAIAVDRPGTTSYGDAGFLERERFLAAAAEHERVAALEAHDALAALGRADHQAVDAVLIDRVPAGALADVEPLRLRRELEQPLRDERVVEHEVGLAQPARAAR